MQAGGCELPWQLACGFLPLAPLPVALLASLFLFASSKNEWGGQRCFLVVMNVSKPQILKTLLASF